MKIMLVDTDILIDFLRGKDSSKGFLLSEIDDSSICCSVITVAEIYAGMKELEREKTECLLNSLIIFDITREIAEKAGMYKNTYKDYNLELDDCLIAATVFTNNAVLATGNMKHYPMKDITKVFVK